MTSGYSKFSKTLGTLGTAREVAPAIDILSSATQIPDMGAKILLIYCCLEHLFVPRNVEADNKKYIVGGMNALAPRLLPGLINCMIFGATMPTRVLC